MVGPRGAVVAAFAFFAAPAGQACEYDSFEFQLPGESFAVAKERAEKIDRDLKVVRHFQRESRAYELAQRIYLGRVIAQTPWQGRTLPTATVHPMHALKGNRPQRDRVLTGQPAGSMCWDVGDGLAAFGKVGELVVVFEGLPQSAERPRGIDSFRATSIRTIKLLDALSAYGKHIEE